MELGSSVCTIRAATFSTCRTVTVVCDASGRMGKIERIWSAREFYNPMRLRICQIVPTLDQGGAEKQLCLLASRLDPSKFESHVLVLTRTGPLEDELVRRGVQVHQIGKSTKLDPRALGRLSTKLRQIAPHVVHSWIFAANCYGRLAAWRAKVPVIIAGERCVDPWKKWWHHALDRQFAKFTDAIATNSSAVVNFYAEHGIRADQFVVIPNAIEPYRGKTLTRAEVFSRLNIEPADHLVMAVGRLWPQKGYKDLVWSGELINVALKSTRFVIFGDGPERERLRAYRDQIGASASVRFAGHRADAAELITGADLLWNGSLYEGQSNTILEAMNVAVPVIATDIPGNRDLVIHGQTGYLYPVGDVEKLTRATVQVLEDRQLRNSLGAQGTARVQAEFSLEKMVERHEKLYLDLCARRGISCEAPT